MFDFGARSKVSDLDVEIGHCLRLFFVGGSGAVSKLQAPFLRAYPSTTRTAVLLPLTYDKYHFIGGALIEDNFKHLSCSVSKVPVATPPRS